MNKAPAYQMYVNDWLGSRNVRIMEDYQRGWFITLLNEAWANTPQCFLPDDDELLQRIAGVSNHTRSTLEGAFNARWSEVRNRFKVEGKNIFNERQMQELIKQQHHAEKSREGGCQSALKRKRKMEELQAIKKQILENGNQNARGLEGALKGPSIQVQPESNSSSSIASSTSTSYNTPIPPKGGCDEAKQRKPRSKKSYDGEFEIFWNTTRFPKRQQDTKGEMFKKYCKAIKEGCAPEEIATAADAFADGNASVEFPIGMRKFLEPMTIREWLSKPESPKQKQDEEIKRIMEKAMAQAAREREQDRLMREQEEKAPPKFEEYDERA